MVPVSFRSADRLLTLKNKRFVNLFIVSLFKREKQRLASITYIFCSDEFLLQLNRQFLQHDYYTDIITFTLSENSQPIEAELYISIDRVKENAKNLGKTYSEELRRVIFHGALHLCGYKDKKKSEITIMRQKEDEYLRLFEQRRPNA
jgi:probable rRNA maturation factor